MKSIHSCLEIKEIGNQCKVCLVPFEKCKIMVNILNNEFIYSSKPKYSLKGLQESDIQDVVSEIIKVVMQMKYSGNTDKQFAQWVRGIAIHKRADYFRRKYSDSEKTKDFSDLNNLPVLIRQEDFNSAEKEYDTNDFLEKLKEKVSDGDVKGTDFNVILTLYDGLKKGLTQKEIAEEMGIKPNTLNQQLKRIREKLRKKGISLEP